jgi:hypothetical protein
MSEYQSVDASASPETQMNENMETIEYSTVYGKRQPVTTGLTWGYYGGRWGSFSVSAGTLSLTNAADNYIVVLRSNGVISVSTSSTNWNNTSSYARVYKLTTAGSVVTVTEDHRAGPYGVHGYIPAAAAITYLAPRVTSTASSGTPTPDADTTDIYILTALAAGATFGAPTGTPVQGQALVIRIKDNGTARALAFNAIYRAVGATLPTTTVISKTMYLGLIYNSTDTKWDVVAVREEA